MATLRISVAQVRVINHHLLMNHLEQKRIVLEATNREVQAIQQVENEKAEKILAELPDDLKRAMTRDPEKRSYDVLSISHEDEHSRQQLVSMIKSDEPVVITYFEKIVEKACKEQGFTVEYKDYDWSAGGEYGVMLVISW